MSTDTKLAYAMTSSIAAVRSSRAGAFVLPVRMWMLVVATLVACSGAEVPNASTAGAAGSGGGAGSDGGAGFGGGGGRDEPEEGDAVVPMPGQDGQAGPESGDVPTPPDANADEPPSDAGAVTYDAHIQPILRTACGSCHVADASAPFVDSYAATQRLSMAGGSYGCPGELVGVCIDRAAQGQALEGAHCRTYDSPFHRDGFDRCLTAHEQSLIRAWVAGGMIER